MGGKGQGKCTGAKRVLRFLLDGNRIETLLQYCGCQENCCWRRKILAPKLPAQAG